MDDALDTALSDLDDAFNDYQSSKFQSSIASLGNFIYHCDQEPLQGFLTLMLPVGLFAKWWDKTKTQRGGMSGSGRLEWPASREDRVAIQLSLCKEIVAGTVPYVDFIHTYCNPGYNSLDAHCMKFAEMILSPLVRDIRKIATRKPLPPSISEALKTLPQSGDSTLDGMLSDAIQKFRAGAHREATERLWDAWERLKTLEVSENKKLSLERLLQIAAPEPNFREMLATESRALTSIGNGFHIRHFETNRTEIVRAAHYDYLFHRLFALLHLLLTLRE